MKGGAQTALALGVGYILGRRRKMRTTTALAIAAATGGLGGLAPTALRRGMKLVGSTGIADAVGPQLGEIATTVRGELLDAGKAAAAAALSSRIESLSDNLHDRAESLRNPQEAVAGAGETGRNLRRRGGRRTDDERDEADERDEDEDYEADEPADERDEADEPADERDEADEPADERDEADERHEDEADERDEDEGRPPRRARRTRSADEDEGTRPRTRRTRAADEDEDEGPPRRARRTRSADDDEEPPRRARRTRSPVTRTRG